MESRPRRQAMQVALPVFLVVLFVLAAGLAQTAGADIDGAPAPAPVTAQPAAGPSGSISGTVTDDGGVPLTGIRVTALFELNISGLLKMWIVEDFVNTDSSGNYQITGLDPAKIYKVEFRDITGTYLTEYYYGEPQLDSAAIVSVTEGQVTGGIDGSLTLPGAISGTVTGEGGQPLANIKVVAGLYGTDLVYSVFTDASGNFTLSGMAPGQYQVLFSTTCDSCNKGYFPEYFNDRLELADADIITVAAGNTTAAIDAALAQVGTISGTIMDEDGNPLPGVSYFGYPARAYRYNDATGSWDYFSMAYSNNGVYTIDWLLPGQYKVSFNHGSGSRPSYGSEFYNEKTDMAAADAITVTAGADIPGIDATLKDLATGSIAGRVTDAGGQPLEGIRVDLQWADGGKCGNCGAITDVNGDYEMTGLLPNSYLVRFSGGVYLPEFYDDRPDYAVASSSGATVLDVQTDVAITGIDASLAVGGSIAGSVTDEGGNPIDNVEVTAVRWDASSNKWYGSYIAVTGAGGSYEITGLYGGDYRILFDGSDVNSAHEYYDNQTDPALAQLVTLPDNGQITGIDATLASAGYAIAGTVADDAGQPLEGIEIHLFRNNGSAWLPYSGGADAVTGPDGKYIVTQLNGEDYKVRFSDPAGDFVSQYFDGQYRLDLAFLVSTVPGVVSAGIDATLERTGTISGTATNASGEPLPSVTVRAYRYNSAHGVWEETEASAVTDTAGAYILGDLVSGEYRVRFSTAGGATAYYDGQSFLEAADAVLVTSGFAVTGIDAALDVGGSISGTISNESGQPYPGQAARVYSQIGGNWVQVRGIETDDSGNYLVSGLAAGEYRVGFGKGPNGYSSHLSTLFFDGVQQIYAADPVFVTDGHNTPGIDGALLENPGRITGTVRDENGQPLANTVVVPYRVDAPGVFIYTGKSVKTDGAGNYSIGDLFPGDYVVSFNGAGYFYQYYNVKPDRDSADPVAVTAGNVTPGIDAALVKGGSISGNVTDATGQPLKYISVKAYRLENGAWREASWAQTDVNGDYSIARLTTGQYKVQFYDYNNLFFEEFFDDQPDMDSAQLVPVTQGSDTPGIDAFLVAAPSGSISGSVTDAAGQPLAGIEVDIYKLQLFGGGWKLEKTVISGSDGSYSATGMQTGEYKVGFNVCTRLGNGDCDDGYLPEYYNDVPDLDSAELVPVTWGSDTGNIDASLGTAGSISGTVTDGSGTPLGDVYIYIDRLDLWSGELRRANIIWNMTAADGTYRLAGLPTGSYRLYFSKTGYDSEYFNDKGDGATADLVAVAAGNETAGVDASLAGGSGSGSGSISGRITSASGAALANIPVYLYRYDSAGGVWKSLGSTVKSNAAGYYTVGSLLPGDYKVSFNELRHYQSNKNYAPEVYNGKPDFDSGDAVTLATGASVTGIDASLDAGGKISGRVTDEFGQPLTGIYVAATHAGSDPYLWSLGNGVLTDANGNYTITGLNTGDYQVGFLNNCYYNCAGGYATEYYDDITDPNAAVPVPVTVGATTSGIDASLAVGGAITGIVRDELGTPVDFISYEITRHDGANSWFAGLGYSGDAGWGDYSFGGLAAGDYTVRFYQDVDDFSLDFSARKHWIYRLPVFYDGKADAGSADLFQVAFGGTTPNIDAVLYFYDEDSPLVTYDGPAGETGEDSAVLMASYMDGTGTGIDMSSAQVTLDGNDITGDCSVGIRSLQCPVSGLAPGGHDVTVSISDYAGNTGSTQGAFSVSLVAPDITPPTTSDDAPGGWQNAPFTVNLVCADDPGGSGCAETLFSVDSGPEQAGNAVTINTDGDHTIEYHSTDNAGNAETPQTVHAMLDTTVPAIDNIQPDGTVHDADTTISADLSDTGAGVDTASVVVKLDGNPLAGCTVAADSVSCPTGGLTEGSHAIAVSVSDNAGNTGTASGSFDVDLPPAFDFGDAPDSYGTLLVSDGARHVAGSNLYLGGCVDTEDDGRPSSPADGDDDSAGAVDYGNCALAGDDEEGVAFTGLIVTGANASVDVIASSPGTLSAWVDFNGDGDFNDAEAIFPGGQALAAGANNLTFDVPASAVPGDTYARFRLATADGLQPDGLAADGEVEDYRIHINTVYTENHIVDTSVAYGTLTLPAGFGGPEYLVRSDTALATELAESLRASGSPPTTPHAFGQDLVDQFGILTTSDFLRGPLARSGRADNLIADQYDVMLALLQVANPGWTFSLQKTVNLVGAESLPLQETLPDGPAPGDSTIVTGTANVAIYEVNGTITATPPPAQEQKKYYFPWYDSRGSMKEWLLMANPARPASGDLEFGLGIGGQVHNLGDIGLGPGVVGSGKELSFIQAGLMGGLVKVSSITGQTAIVSKRTLLGNSFEEIPAVSEERLSDHYYWPWYDELSGGFQNWVVIANPSETETVHAAISFRNREDNRPVTMESDIGPGGSWVPEFPGKMGGPVEVKSYLAPGAQPSDALPGTEWGTSWPGDARPVVASQRVLTGNGTAFNELLGIPARELSDHYLWAWYDNLYARNWIILANPHAHPVDYTIIIDGYAPITGRLEAAGDPQGRDITTPVFDGVIGGPVEVSASDKIVASQRSLWGASFGEVPGYPAGSLASDYHMAFYDMSDPGVQNWVVVANPNGHPVDYSVRIAGAVVDTGRLEAAGDPQGRDVATPVFPGIIGGPVQVTSSGGPVMASQRVLWNGYFNELSGIVLN